MILVSASDVQILMLSRGAAIKTLDLDGREVVRFPNPLASKSNLTTPGVQPKRENSCAKTCTDVTTNRVTNSPG